MSLSLSNPFLLTWQPHIPMDSSRYNVLSVVGTHIVLCRTLDTYFAAVKWLDTLLLYYSGILVVR